MSNYQKEILNYIKSGDILSILLANEEHNFNFICLTEPDYAMWISPLYLALRDGATQATYNFLIQQGADINYVCPNTGMTSLSCFLSNQGIDYCQYDYVDTSSLSVPNQFYLFLIRKNKIVSTKELIVFLDSIFNVDTELSPQESYGIIKVVASLDVQVLKYLLENHINIQNVYTDAYDSSELMSEAIIEDNLPQIGLLELLGLEIPTDTDSFYTSLMNNDVEYIKLMMRRKYDITQLHEGIPLFFHALDMRNTSSKDHVVPCITDSMLTILSEDGNNALHQAVEWDDTDFLHAALAKGFSKTHLNNNGETPYQMAQRLCEEIKDRDINRYSILI